MNQSSPFPLNPHNFQPRPFSDPVLCPKLKCALHIASSLDCKLNLLHPAGGGPGQSQSVLSHRGELLVEFSACASFLFQGGRAGIKGCGYSPRNSRMVAPSPTQFLGAERVPQPSPLLSAKEDTGNPLLPFAAAQKRGQSLGLEEISSRSLLCPQGLLNLSEEP